MGYRPEDDPNLLNEKMIKLLIKQNDLLKERLKIEMEQNAMYRDELHRQRMIEEDEDRIQF